ncbi:MAG: SusD family protein [Firmicutes bacterium ADurb.Bin080]|jgi:hypothetical protein|nr:MAG: SusD family protein [Firmicutes bacterium ADurb.Bin080]HHV13941.1 RagB/SusD family nutrient uptake outer membrane protein [Clostridiales bacterium]
MKKTKYIPVILWFIILTGSCEVLDSVENIKPLYRLTEETTFTDAKKTEAVLNGVYTAWKNSSINIFTAQTMLLSGNYTTTSSIGVDASINRVDVTSSYLSSYYRAYYSLLMRANYLIKALEADFEIPGLNQARRTEMKAEARLQRAMAHFFLLRNFGQFYNLNSDLGIVLQEAPLTGTPDNPRSGVLACYNSILLDIDYAMANAPISARSYGLLTRDAAKAMKAKVLLYMGDWTEAARLALEIINLPTYELETDFKSIYGNGFKSKEVIFSPVSIYPAHIDRPGSSTFSPGPLLISTADKSVGDPNDGDPVTGEGFDPRFAYAHAQDNVALMRPNNKYPFGSVTGEQANSLFILRLGELYLIFAEAKAREAVTGVDSEALAKLNAIRYRAGLLEISTSSKAEFLEAIRIEKQLELFGEFNEPWFDMVRYYILGDLNISDLKSEITSDNQLILPFPDAALSGNGGLIQNPGY